MSFEATGGRSRPLPLTGPMDPMAVIIRASQLLSDKRAFTSAAPARDGAGTPCVPDFMGAVSWSAAGAIAYAANGDEDLADQCTEILDSVAHELYGRSLDEVNGGKFGRHRVARIFEEAISRSERRSPR